MNKKLLILGIIFLCLSGGGFSQSKQNTGGLTELILSADIIKEKGGVDSFISNLKIKANLENQDSSRVSANYYNLAICYSSIELIDSSCYFLNLAIEHSSDYNSLIFTDSDFEKLHYELCWGRIIQKIDSSFLSKYPKILNKDLAVELYHIYLRDQHARGLGLKKIDERLRNIDQENLIRVEEIILMYGWPTFSLVGETASKGAFLVIQHANINVQQKYLKLLFDAAINNEASKEWVALLMDRISVMKKGVQIFGTQVYQVRDSIKRQNISYDYFPIKDEKQVDSLRKAFDMIPLKEYYAIYGIDYNPPEK